ncbi:hypothetical protein Acsp06_13530 [Actinomycetospora sp. NBRC 106375]|nr:hypothetical protein Acsp06_13530 [Actinomycetospora sp. NBRC 106375]
MDTAIRAATGRSGALLRTRPESARRGVVPSTGDLEERAWGAHGRLGGNRPAPPRSEQPTTRESNGAGVPHV